MKTTRAAVAITLLALLGLVVSLTAVWSQLTPDALVQEQELGPSASQPPGLVPSILNDEPARQPRRAGGSAGAVPERDDESVASRPVRVAVSAVGIDAAVRSVGVAADGQMQLPPNPEVLGWYRFGPSPGADGSAVLAGHLDSRRYGLGPLVRLRNVEPGDLVEVTSADGSSRTYRVDGIARFEQEALPADVFARTGAPRLRLITCGGEYDVDAGGYQQNLVVTAVPV
jgi:hypothetical protein